MTRVPILTHWIGAKFKRKMDELENSPPVPEEHHHIFGRDKGTVSKSKLKRLEDQRERLIEKLKKQGQVDLIDKRRSKTRKQVAKLDNLNKNKRPSRLREISTEIRMHEDIEFEAYLAKKHTKH